MGPLFGTIAGIGTWLALILKVAFALVGMGAYISLFVPELPIVPIAVMLAVLLSIVNLVDQFGLPVHGLNPSCQLLCVQRELHF